MQVTPGTRALITGASRGIGRALAAKLAARGAMLGLAARSTEQLQALADELPGNHLVLECDVADSASTQRAIDAFAKQAGGLDLLIANAGITHYGPFRDQPLDDAIQMSRVNWHGTLHTVHFGLPHLLRAAVYGATKAAISPGCTNSCAACAAPAPPRAATSIQGIEYDVFLADCPARTTLGLVADTWSVVVVYALGERPRRYAELQERIGGISKKMLTQTLRKLERNGLVERRRIRSAPPGVEYRLTKLGQTLLDPVRALSRWAEQHTDELLDAQAAA